MPSASTKPENKASSEASEPIKQAIVVVDKKVRNLEKRKGKLDVYRQKRQDGEDLNKDQQDAVSKYDTVVQNLEFAKELQKQFIAISAEADKIMKKQSKREKVERQASEVKRIKELLQLQNILDSLGSDTARQDFQEGKRGAVVLTEENLNQLDELYKLISPTRDGESNYLEALTAASEHIVNFLDGREKDVAGTTYKDLKALVDKVNECGYFDNMANLEEAEEAEAAPEAIVEQAEVPAETTETQEYEYKEQTEEPVAEVEEEVAGAPVMPIKTGTPPPAVASTMVEPEPEQTEVVPPNAVYNDESFFSTAPYQRATRPFNEIVSSVQGTFNFLQDSQIDLDSPHMDPAVVAAQPMGPPSLGHPGQADSSMPGGFPSSNLLSEDQLAQSQILPPQMQSETQADPVNQQQQQPPSAQHPQSLASAGMSQSQTSNLVSQQPLDSSAYSTDTDFGQNLMSQGLQGSSQLSFTTEQSGFGQSGSVGGIESSVGGMGASGEVPPAIPMPNPSLSQGLGSTDATAENQEKKTFSMNPNAAMFQSMYQQQHMTTLAQGSEMSSSGVGVNTMAGQDKYGQQQGGEYSEYKNSSGFGQSGYQRNGNGGGRGGPRGGGGRGGRGGNMSNGFPGGRNNRGGNNSGVPYNMAGRGGGQGGQGGGYNGNRGGGGGNRGVFQGYPPRNDYRPEGYQGYSNGYSYNKRGGSGPPRGAGGRGGVMRGGPPRGGGGMRGGNRGGNFGSGSRPGSGHQQQHSGSPIQQAAA